MVKRIIFSISVVFFIALVASAIIAYGRGYRFNLEKNSLSSTGILSASSYPEKASIWIDDELMSATNASISLSPGWYDVQISKEGYEPWKKRVRVQGEVVSQVDALLVPINPSLNSLTITGVTNPVIAPSGTKVAYIVPEKQATQSGVINSKNGLWLLDFKQGPLGGKAEPKALYQPTASLNWENARITWSFDEKEILLTFIEETTEIEEENIISALLIQVEGNNLPTNVTPSYEDILTIWQEEEEENKQTRITKLFHPSIGQILTKSTNFLNFSPDETKVLYLATSSATLAQVITPPIIGSNPTEEVRKLEKDKFYVYDIKEDKNYQLSDITTVSSPQSFRWYSDSKHIIMIENDNIYIIDYDGDNKRTIYTGPFSENVAYPWPGGNKIIILTNLNKADSPPNFYEIDLR